MLASPRGKTSFSDLQGVLGFPESKTLEFKAQMPAGTNDEKIKFLAAVTSLANSSGGDLLIGVEATDGMASAITGVEVASVDAEKLRLEHLLSSLVEPRLPNAEIEPVSCGANRYVFAVRTARSWLAPHRVRLDNKFYGRNSSGKYPLDVSQIRDAFLLSGSTVERMRSFRAERLIKIGANKSPFPLSDTAAMVIHVVPFSTFANGEIVDVVAEIANGTVFPVPPGSWGWANRPVANLDGLAVQVASHEGRTLAYSQVFRTGAVEGVLALNHGIDNQNWIVSSQFETDVLTTSGIYINLVSSLDLGAPMFAFLSFIGMKECRFRRRTEFGSGFYDHGPLREDVIALRGVEVHAGREKLENMFRTTFNTVWNAFGLAKSDKYNDKGEWIGPTWL